MYLIYQNYSEEAVPINTTENNEEEETKSLRRRILDYYEITGNMRDEILCDTVYDYLGDGKKKIVAELQSMGVAKRKSNKGTTRDKLCFQGIKKIVEPETDNP